jgi:hypothetical protein
LILFARSLASTCTTTATTTTTTTAAATTTATVAVAAANIAATTTFPFSSISFSVVVEIIQYCCEAHIIKRALFMIKTNQVHFEDLLEDIGLEPLTEKM